MAEDDAIPAFDAHKEAGDEVEKWMAFNLNNEKRLKRLLLPDRPAKWTVRSAVFEGNIGGFVTDEMLQKRFRFTVRLQSKFLGAPMSASFNERFFSGAGLVMTPKRSALKDERSEMLSILRFMRAHRHLWHPSAFAVVVV